MRKVTAYNNQTLFDIALQETGDLANAYQIAYDNGISVTDDVQGMVLQVADFGSNKVLEHYRVNNIKPATHSTLEVVIDWVLSTGHWEPDAPWTLDGEWMP